MDTVNARVLNEVFMQKLETPEGKFKLASGATAYVRDRLREVCFTDKIIPPDPITAGDKQVQVSENHDTLAAVIELEPKSRAMTVTFRGEATTNFIRAPRMFVPFFTISSEKYVKTEEELLAYRMPITKVIEDNSVKDLQEVKDREFLRHAESAVQALQTEANGSVTALRRTNYASVVKKSIIKGQGALQASADNFEVFPVLKPDLVNLFKLMDGERLRTEKFILTEVDFDDFLMWTLQDNGDKLQSEVTVDGYKYNTLVGRKLIRTIKTDILRPGNIYSFAAPEFLGKSFILNNTKFYIDKIGNTITWWSWMTLAIGIANVTAIRKLELYPGSVTPGATDTGFAAKLPVDEDELGAMNNRVDQGLKYPDVAQF